MSAMTPIRIILDADIGGDIDDVLALAFALNSPEVNLLAVTTVNTDPAMRARIATKMLHTFGFPQVPVAAGEKDMFNGSLTRCKDINAAVILTLDDPVPKGNGVDLIIRTIRAHPCEVTLIGIGCWTNIARAFQKAPDLQKTVKRLVLMGGKIEPPGAESNIVCDPYAAAYVFDLPVPKMIVPLDVTMQCRYPASRHGGLFLAGNARTNLVRDLIRAWQIGRHDGNPASEPILHDPLAVGLAFIPTLIKKTRVMHLRVEFPNGGHSPVTVWDSDSEPNAEVVVEIDRERFEDIFAERILLGG